MLTVGDTLPDFTITGVKPGFMRHEENGESAFETLTPESFPGKWKVIFFYPKDFTFVCPTEIAEFARLNSEFAARDAVVLGGSTDNEHSKLAWRRDHADLRELPIWNFADSAGRFRPEYRHSREGRRRRATRHLPGRPEQRHPARLCPNLNVGRAPADTLRVLDALQTDELCACNRAVGGDTLKAA